MFILLLFFQVRFYKVGPQGLVSPQMKHDRHLAFSNACKKASIRAVKEVRVVEADSEAVEEGVVAQLLTSGVRILHLVRVRDALREYMMVNINYYYYYYFKFCFL